MIPHKITYGLIISVLFLAACSDSIKLEWKYEIGTRSVSTPLVTDDFIAMGSEQGVYIVSLDGEQKCFFDAHGEVISAPKTDGKLIFFGSTNYIFYAIEPTCSEKWKFDSMLNFL